MATDRGERNAGCASLRLALGAFLRLRLNFGGASDSGREIQTDLVADALQRRQLECHAEDAIHDLVEGRLSRVIRPGGLAGAAAEAGNLVNAYRLDLFCRLHHLRDDLRQLVEPVLLKFQAHKSLTARVL